VRTVTTSVLFPSMLTLVMKETAAAVPHFKVVVKVAVPPATFDG